MHLSSWLRGHCVGCPEALLDGWPHHTQNTGFHAQRDKEAEHRARGGEENQ